MHSENSGLIEFDLLADVLSISKSTLSKWERDGRVRAVATGVGKRFRLDQLIGFSPINAMMHTDWEAEQLVKPLRAYSSIELFAGAGGLAIGLERSGFEAIVLNEFDKHACETLRQNRPDWNVVEGDVRKVDFRQYKGVDFLSGGFPCQAFSYAGKQLGFEDTRGTLFFEFARVVSETQPKVFLAENVRGLLVHDEGRTLETIKRSIAELGYTLIEPRVLKAIFYRVPQKRERLFLVGIRNDLVKFSGFRWPSPFKRVMVLKDALKAGELFDSDVPNSSGQRYPNRKAEIFSLVPMGGYWRDLPEAIQREYMQGSFYLGGGKTGMARRLAWNVPSLTLTCSPAQKQTERCHPEENRPLTVREYARIQTFPDNWRFSGPIGSQYKQIGNAVPVKLASAVGGSIIRLLNGIESRTEPLATVSVCRTSEDDGLLFPA